MFRTDETGEGDVLIITVDLSQLGHPARELQLMAEFELLGSTIVARRAHLQGSGRNTIGVSLLREIAELMLAKVGYDELIVEGFRRTTGAGPGHTPKPLRFKRKRCTSPIDRGEQC